MLLSSDMRKSSTMIVGHYKVIIRIFFPLYVSLFVSVFMFTLSNNLIIIHITVYKVYTTVETPYFGHHQVNCPDYRGCPHFSGELIL